MPNKIILTKINEIPIYRNFIENLPYNIKLKERSRALRKIGNFPEVVFWKQVHKSIFWKIDFDRQRIIGNYIVDFYIKPLGLVIEIDGNSHNDKDLYDSKREEFLISFGIKIIRFSDYRILNDLDNVMKELEDFIIKEYGT
jgi:very-short-patch-repair endonuclease